MLRLRPQQCVQTARHSVCRAASRCARAAASWPAGSANDPQRDRAIPARSARLLSNWRWTLSCSANDSALRRFAVRREAVSRQGFVDGFVELADAKDALGVLAVRHRTPNFCG